MDIIEKIKNELKNESYFHAYLLISLSDEEFSEVIESFKDHFGLKDFDFTIIEPEVEALSKKGEIKVEQVKHIASDLSLSFAKKRICIIKQCNRLNQASANSLLKILEEPPKNVIFLLFAETDNVLPTIKSRCRTYRTKDHTTHNFSYDEILTGNIYQAFNLIEQTVKDGQEKDLMAWLEQHLEKKLVESYSTNYVNLLSDLAKMKKRMSNNINLRLNFENLILKIRQEDK